MPEQWTPWGAAVRERTAWIEAHQRSDAARSITEPRVSASAAGQAIPVVSSVAVGRRRERTAAVGSLEEAA